MAAEFFALIEREPAPHQSEFGIQVTVIVACFDDVRAINDIDGLERDASLDAEFGRFTIDNHAHSSGSLVGEHRFNDHDFSALTFGFDRPLVDFAQTGGCLVDDVGLAARLFGADPQRPTGYV